MSSLLGERDAEPTLQVSPGALLSDQLLSKEGKREKRRGGGLSLGRSKPRDSATEKVYWKGKHTRNKSGSRTPPDSPRGERMARGGKGQPSPNVKGHRKRYSQLGLDLSSAESGDGEEEEEEEEGEEEEEEEEVGQTYFTNHQAASEATDTTRSQEPFFTIEKEAEDSHPASPGPWTTVQFPVQFGEAGAGLLLSSAFEPQPSSQTGANEASIFLPDSAAWSPAPSAPASTATDPVAEVSSEEPVAEVSSEEQTVPEAEWRVSVELRLKCRRQFLELQPTHGRLQGRKARTFFLQSRLPNSDLSAIWRLADIDRDNALSEEEFCVAMKLVLLRRKGYSLPTSVPLSLRDSAVAEPRKKLAPLLASRTVGDLPVPPAEQLLVDVTEPSSPLFTTTTTVERRDPAVATIISLTDEEAPTSESFSEDTAHPSVRRALSLKQFSPPAAEAGGHSSSPASPFSPPHSTETAPIISFQNPSPPKAQARKPTSASRSGYQMLPGSEEEGSEEAEGLELQQLTTARERGHGRSTSLDLNKMIPGSSVLSDMPAAEPPRPPPKPVAEDGDVSPQTRGRSASTGSISSTGPSLPPPASDSAAASARLLPGTSHAVPARKAPLLPPVPKPRRPPPPKREPRETAIDEDVSSLTRDKSELQMTIRSLKDTNATLQVLNRELEEKLFRLMEDRVQLAREVELARQMQTTS